ncbi:type II secretion system minor pseudopilin GspJ [Catenovulum maritimum]|nr:type II secretion system minor pseudopilin GspJ [Catenovulum maritimum]
MTFPYKMQRQQGFTLIEMLLAISIFALMSLAGFNILSSTVDSNELSLKHGDKMAKLQRAMLTIERDFTQISQRKVRINGEAPSANLLAHGELILDSESQVLAFRRVGWTNPMNMLPRSEVQSLAYRIFDGNLERLHYVFPDPVQGEEPKVRVLLEDVEQIEFEFFDPEAKSWQTTWEKTSLPSGVSIKLYSQDFGEIQRVFNLVN